ncbi:MAG: hypothetical protein ACKOBR_12105 [Actinomycetota bacterium]
MIRKRLIAHRFVLVTTFFLVSACGGAGSGENNSSTGPRIEAIERGGYEELAECPDGDVLLSHFPLNEGDHGFITPLGFLMPPAHVFPTMHMYVQVNGTEYQSNGDVVLGNSKPLIAPADMTVVEIRAFETITPDGGWTEYDISFGICRDVIGRFGHVGSLTGALLAAVSAAPSNCYPEQRLPGSWTDRRYRLCPYELNIQVRAGDVIGSVGDRNGNLDFRLNDFRKPELQFANQQRWSPLEQHTACFLDYYPADMKARYYEILGVQLQNFTLQRTQDPRCGEVAVDIPGTAKGAWFFQLSGPMQSEGPHLAFANDAVDPSIQMISMGESAMGVGVPPGRYTFTPTDDGLVNREFSQVTSDGNVYCYDTNVGQNQNFTTMEKVLILLQMPNAEKIRVGRGNGSCSDPQSLGEYVEFDR